MAQYHISEYLANQYLNIFLNQSDCFMLEYEIQTGNVLTVIPEKQNLTEEKARQNIPESWIILGLIHSDSVPVIREAFSKIQKGCKNISCEIQIVRKNQEYQWRQLHLQVLVNPDGTTDKAVCLSENITLQKEAEIAFIKEEQYRKALISHALIYAQIDLTENRFMKYSAKEGWKKDEDLSYDEYVSKMEWTTVHETDQNAFRSLFNRKHLIEAFEKGEREFSLEHRRVNHNGIYSWVNSKLYLLKDPITDHLEGLFYLEDIDSQKRESLLLQHNSEIDLLTNLYNKSTTEGKIKGYLELSDSVVNTHALLFLDIDDFKRINDTFGHAEGDYVLKNIGYFLKKSFRSYDVVGRIGGDEFIIFMHDIPSDLTAVKGAEKICTAFRDHKESLKEVSCSIGIALYPEHGTNFMELYEKADIALYRAKKAGKDTYMIYN